VALGNLRCSRNLAWPAGEAAGRADALRAEGQTVMFVAVDGAVAGSSSVRRPDQGHDADAIRQLHAEGVRIVMLTGDSRVTAEAVARRLGIDEVIPEVLPDQKAAVDRAAAARGAVVAMAGDGINDAPGPGAGAGGHCDGHRHRRGDGERRRDAREGRPARHRARPPPEPRHDEQHPPEPVLRVRLQRARRADRAGVLYPLFGLLLSPMIAAAAMSLSSVSVIGNALRLRRAAL
jgi:Cu+-exporting ATPase